MSCQDPLSEMLTVIRNALPVRKRFVKISHSCLKESVLKILKDSGYIIGYEVISSQSGKKILHIDLKYYKGYPVIRELRRLSRPGLRHYVSSKKIPRILGGLGISILSTSRGVISGYQARALSVGGEVLCAVY